MKTKMRTGYFGKFLRKFFVFKFGVKLPRDFSFQERISTQFMDKTKNIKAKGSGCSDLQFKSNNNHKSNTLSNNNNMKSIIVVLAAICLATFAVADPAKPQPPTEYSLSAFSITPSGYVSIRNYYDQANQK